MRLMAMVVVLSVLCAAHCYCVCLRAASPSASACMESTHGPSTPITRVPHMGVSCSLLTHLTTPSPTPSPSPPLPSVGSSELDIRLHYPFLCLSPENVLKVIAAILAEKRIIFSSSHYTLLTFVIEVGLLSSC